MVIYHVTKLWVSLVQLDWVSKISRPNSEHVHWHAFRPKCFLRSSFATAFRAVMDSATSYVHDIKISVQNNLPVMLWLEKVWAYFLSQPYWGTLTRSEPPRHFHRYTNPRVIYRLIFLAMRYFIKIGSGKYLRTHHGCIYFVLFFISMVKQSQVFNSWWVIVHATIHKNISNW